MSSHKPSSYISQDQKSQHNSTPKILDSFSISGSFNIPPSPESAAVRIIKNFGKFNLNYAIFLWAAFFITIVPKRDVSATDFVPVTGFIFPYFWLLRTISTSVIFHRRIEKRFLMLVLFVMLFLLFVLMAFMMILTIGDGIYVSATVAAAIGFILVHAVLSKREDMYMVVNEKGEEMIGDVQEKINIGECDSNPQNLV